jgi:multidrug efflux pump
VLGSSLNLYSRSASSCWSGSPPKNGILIVEFANQLRDQGRDVREAIRESAAVRLRPS